MAQVSVFQGRHPPPGKAAPCKNYLCAAINNLYSNPEQHHTEKSLVPLFFLSPPNVPYTENTGMEKSIINLLDHICSGYTLQKRFYNSKT